MKFRIVAGVLLLMMSNCENRKKKETETMLKDPHSFSRPQEARVKHLAWTATVDFDLQQIRGVATWNIETDGKANVIVLDTKGLTIEKVSLDDNQETTFKFGKGDQILGQPLEIDIRPATRQVSIAYTTSPEAEAVQWLKPEQTAGKIHPFLFTQSQAILARSWVPCQDSPGIRFTYQARVTVPKELMALMSASNPQQKNDLGVYQFEMKQPIPSYLLALAVGELEFRSISSRSGVYAEPSLVDTSAWEFGDLEKMIASAEELYGSYQWERYDVLVLPPSFPFGGMENPRLTFATPTILAGDRSLTSLIAHELAHSWSGNLVTNATWNDFWLNEGFTVYFETRIMEKLYGEDYAEMLASLNLQDLKDEISSLTADGHGEDTKLLLKLEGRNPDDGVTEIAYNKGYYFLRSIEEKYGRDKFDTFVKTYFSENAFKAMDTDGFVRYIKGFYKNKFDIALDDTLFTSWIHAQGLPAVHAQPRSDRFKKVDEVLAAWKAEKPLDKTHTRLWSTHEWLHFLKNLPATLSARDMQTLDEFGNFTTSGNAEIITAWGVISIRNGYAQMDSKIESFLIHTGRRKFLSPLYHELIKTEEGKKRARAI
ncbi:MAG: M1 family metallopeptidase, partial [Bacteroidota bacterium]